MTEIEDITKDPLFNEPVVINLVNGKQVLGVLVHRDRFSTLIYKPIELVETQDFLGICQYCTVSDDDVTAFHNTAVTSINLLHQDAVDFYNKSCEYVKVKPIPRTKFKEYVQTLEGLINPDAIPEGTTIH